VGDSLAPEAAEPLLRGRLGRPYLYRERCEATRSLLAVDMPEGAVGVCEERRGGERPWPPRGAAILCSVLLRPPAERSRVQLSLVAAIAAADAIEQALRLAVQIKWPNEVMVNRFKVGRTAVDERAGATLVDIEINVNQTRAELSLDDRPSAASLLTIDGKRRDRAPLLADLLAALERAYERWLDGGLAGLYVWLGPRDFLRGRRVAVDGTSGVAIGVDRSGRLELDVAGERRFLERGEVVYEQ
jgi:BirA family biotin operon repressor/biotin-[acetyl-CoA-carboxylase] ligase